MTIEGLLQRADDVAVVRHHGSNCEAEVVLGPNEVMRLEALLPRPWQGGMGHV